MTNTKAADDKGTTPDAADKAEAKAAADAAKGTTPDAADKAEAKAAADAAKNVKRVNPDDAKSDPVVDFGTYDDAAAQAKALGKGAYVEAIGTAYRVVTGSDNA